MTQGNLLLSLLFSMNLRIRYFSPERKLGGLLKPFKVLHQCIRSFPSLIRMSFSKKTVKKPFLCRVSWHYHPRGSSWCCIFPSFMFYYPSRNPIQISQLDNTLATIVPSNNRDNSSTIHASTTIQEQHPQAGVVCFIYTTSPEIAFRYPNRTALWPKLSPRIIVQLSMRGIQTYWNLLRSTNAKQWFIFS